MKVIIMVAGKGTRISDYIGGIPKSLVNIGNGTPLILSTIHMLKNNNINDITLVVGYKHKMIENAVKDENIKVIYNPFYSVTNSMGSLYLARNQLDDDVILANGDVFWEENLLNKLLHSEKDVTMLSDKTRADNGDFFFNVDNNGKIVAFGKELTRDNRNSEYVGLCKIKKSFLNTFKQKMNEMIENEEYFKWWENICYDMSNEVPIYALDVDGDFWAEVDRMEDYLRIKKYCEDKQATNTNPDINNKGL